jgi:hypothetical protein
LDDILNANMLGSLKAIVRSFIENRKLEVSAFEAEKFGQVIIK